MHTFVTAANTEALRLAELQEYGIDHIDDVSALESLLKLASELSGVRSAAINIVTSSTQTTIAAVNPHYPSQLDRNLTLCSFVVASGRMMEAPDASVDLRLCNSPNVVAPDGLRFYAGYPLVSKRGAVLGTLCLSDTVPHVLTARQKARVAGLAEIAGTLLKVYRTELRRSRIAAMMEVQSAALRLNQRAVEASSNGVLIVDAQRADMPIIYANRAFETLTGYTQAEILGQNCRFLQGKESDQAGLRSLRLSLQSHQDGHALLRNYRKDGTAFWVDLHTAPVRDEQGTVTHYVGFQTDCTERIRYQDELLHQAGHDSLTGLANRSLLQDRIEQALIRTRSGEQTAIVFIDLDRFKLINDSMGHAAGDLLLKECALRISAKVSQSDTVARMGGDEFVLLLHQVAGPLAVQQQTDTILTALNAPFYINGDTIAISASAGIALHPAHGDTTSALLRNADIAMYDAKSHGRDNSRVFSTNLSARAADSLRLKAELKIVLAEQQFCLHYQPKIHASSGALVGFEALVRWNHPVRGLLYPVGFIDAAEEFGLINELGSWVMHEARRQARAWHLAGRHMVSVAVNVSVAQFRNQAFLTEVENTLRQTGLAARFLELEITESLVMESPQQFIQILAHLHRIGVTISVDDFGTGYSSLSFVKQFPIDYLKIGKSFVNDISTDPSDAAICETIITMGHNLGLLVIAEGVETIAQALFLREHGCDILQGYLIARPQPPDSNFGDFPRLLECNQPMQVV